MAFLQNFILFPLYLFTAPTSMLSSSLFDWIRSLFEEDQTVMYMTVLSIYWVLSALLTAELIINRKLKEIFFYEFIFFLVISNFVFIGVTYNLLNRFNCLEEIMVKVMTSLILILTAEELRTKSKKDDGICCICLQNIKRDCIFLKCNHSFHEKCVWTWMSIKSTCPYCRKPIQ